MNEAHSQAAPADATGASRPLLLAYLHLRSTTPKATREHLSDGIRTYAGREGFQLACLFVAVDGLTDALTLDNLLVEIQRLDARWVLVTGPSPAALRALDQITTVRVLTLSDAIDDPR